MFEHPQFTYDRYAQEIHRVEERIEMVRVINERREDAVRNDEPRRRGWLRKRRESRADAAKVAPVIPAGIGSAVSAIGR